MLNINLASIAAAIKKDNHAPDAWEFHSIELYEISQCGLAPYFTYLVTISAELPGSCWNGLLFKVCVYDGDAAYTYFKKFVNI
jgi:hypothetical protein